MLKLKRASRYMLLLLMASSAQLAQAAPGSWYNDETIFTPNSYVKFLNSDSSHTIQLDVQLPTLLYLTCNPGSGVVIKNSDPSSGTYSLNIPPSSMTTAVSAATPTSAFCYFHYKIGHAQRHYWLLDSNGPIKLNALYQGSVVAQGELYFGVFEPSTAISFKPLQSDLSDGTSVCRGGVSSQFPVFWINSAKEGSCSGTCHGAAIDATSEIAGVYTVQMTQRGTLNAKGKQCDANKTPFSIGPNYGVIKITPTGFTQIDADTSYVEVLNQTDNTLYWGYTDLYNYFASTTKTFDSLSPEEQAAAYQSVAPGQSSYLNIHKTDTFSLGIQAGPNLLTLYKQKDPSKGVIGKYFWSVMTANLVANTSSGNKAAEGFANLPEMINSSGRPIAVCTNMNPQKPIDLIDGKTLLITVYDPTSYTKPSGCYSADVSEGFNASGYNGGV